MNVEDLDLLQRIATGLARQFGSNCEVAIHDLSKVQTENTIVFIENGHVTGRKVGDGPSHVVLEALQSGNQCINDHLDYLTKTNDGRILKSSTIFINDKDGHPTGVLSINFDITSLIMARSIITDITSVPAGENAEAEYIPKNVNDLLEELIEESIKFVGKPIMMMTKDDKTKAIRFLDKKGAFLIKKSGDRVSKCFGISKYTLYNYLDLNS